MDQKLPTLAVLARALAEGERLRAFAAEPAPARVSESLLPLFLAALDLHRGGPLTCVFPASSRGTARRGRPRGRPPGSWGRSVSACSLRGESGGKGGLRRRHSSSACAPQP